MANIFGTSGGSATVQQAALDSDIKNAFLSNYNAGKTTASSLPMQSFAPRTGDYNVGSDVIRRTALGGEGLYNMSAGAGMTADAGSAGPSYIDAPTARASMVGATGYAPMFGRAEQLSGGDIQNYMNPFTQAVAANTLSDLNRANQMALNSVRGDATSRGAFGGSRQALAEAETNRNFADRASNALSSLYSQGFDTSLRAAQTDVANRQQTSLANLGYGNDASKFGATAFNAAAMANQDAANAMERLNVENRLAAARANQGAYETALQRRLGAGSQLANIGGSQQQQGFASGQALTNLGMADQDYMQQMIDAPRNLLLEQQAIRNQALGVNPAGGSGNVSSSTGRSRQGLFK